MAPTHITNTENFAFIAVLVLKLLSHSILLKSRLLFQKIANFNYCKIINSWNAKFS